MGGCYFVHSQLCGATSAIWSGNIAGLTLFPMLVGGLLCAPGSIAGTAAAYNNFLPFMVGPANHTRMDEITWFNTTPRLFWALGWEYGLSALCYRLTLPENAGGSAAEWCVICA